MTEEINNTGVPASEETVVETPPATEATPGESGQSEAEKKKQEHLDNLQVAIKEAQDELQRTRDAKKLLDNPPAETPPAATPVPDSSEVAKREVRQFALERFLESKPALATNPERVKELMTYYEKIRTASEHTQEGVLRDLGKAYAVVYADELVKQANDRRISDGIAAAEFSSPAIDGGASGYRPPAATADRKLSTDEQQILAKWNMSPSEWQDLNKKYSQ